MFIYLMLLGAILVITFLVQLLVYGYSRKKISTADLGLMVGMPINEELEYQASEL